MRHHLRSCAISVFVLATFLGNGVQAASLDPALSRAAKIAQARIAHAGISALDTCTDITPIVPPVNFQATMTTNTCIYIGSRENVYSFTGTANQTLHFDYSSSAFDVFFILDGPSTHEFGDQVSFLSSGISRIALDYTIPQTGTYTVQAMTLFDFDSTDHPTTGLYTLAITTGSASSCRPDARTLCLSNSRFAVTSDWKTSDGRTGVGTAVPLTTDTGYFWFFGAANVELVIKLLDGRTVNGKYWVFYGALSDVNYTITVTDTEKNTSKTYTNPQGKLASVADTGAFNP